MKYVFVGVLCFKFLFGVNISHYLLPQDAKIVQTKLLHDIKNAKKNIKIAMFMVTNKKLVTALINKVKKDNISIEIAFDSSYNASHPKESKIKSLMANSNIKLYAIRGKKKKKGYGILHSKLIIIDSKVVYLGSANLTKSAYSVNYEILLRFNDQPINRLYRLYFDTMITDVVKNVSSSKNK